jgi:large subunit ribosomal protein L10
MSKAVEMKKGVVAEITEKFEKAASVIVVDYKGLTVEQVTDLRNKFREAGVEYKVYKNTLVRRAAEAVGQGEFINKESLVGTNALAFGYEDPVAPARIIKEFAKENEALELKMGIVEGEFFDKDKVTALANIPSREVLIAKLLGSLKAPVSNFVYLINAIAEKKQEA